jgi:hypothetical protein
VVARTLDDGFYAASRARDIAAGNGAANSVVLIEINSLQEAVDLAAKTGQLKVIVGVSEGNETTMTNVATGPIYREAFAGTSDSFASLFPNENRKLIVVQMERVIGYFTRLGYQIRRDDQVGAIPSTFNWVISW